MDEQLKILFSTVLTRGAEELDSLPIGLTNAVSTFSLNNIQLLRHLINAPPSIITDNITKTEQHFGNLPVGIVIIPAIFMYKNHQLVDIFFNIFNIVGTSNKNDFMRTIDHYVETVLVGTTGRTNGGATGGNIKNIMNIMFSITIILTAICADYAYYTQLTRTIEKYRGGEAAKLMEVMASHATSGAFVCSTVAAKPSTSHQIMSIVTQYVGNDYNADALYNFLNCYSVNPSKYYEDLSRTEMIDNSGTNLLDVVPSGQMMIYEKDTQVNRLINRINTQLNSIKTSAQLQDWANQISGVSTDEARKIYNLLPSNDVTVSTFGRMLNTVLGEKGADNVIRSGKFVADITGVLMASVKDDLLSTTTVSPVDAVWRAIRDKANKISHDFSIKKIKTEFYVRGIINELTDFLQDIQAFANIAVYLIGVNSAAAYATLKILRTILHIPKHKTITGGYRIKTKKRKPNTKKGQRNKRRGRITRNKIHFLNKRKWMN